MCIKKYLDYYYQVIKVDGGFGYKIYNKYSKDKEILELNDEIYDTEDMADQGAVEAIQCHYI